MKYRKSQRDNLNPERRLQFTSNWNIAHKTTILTCINAYKQDRTMQDIADS